MFNIEILEKLGNHHRNIMKLIMNNLDSWKTDKEIYDEINLYMNNFNLKKAFPIGISINNVVAHDSYHESNLKILCKGDFIKVDVGLIEEGNIIDSARTFVYQEKNLEESDYNPIKDSKFIVEQIEKFIQKEIDLNGNVLIQRISTLTNALIISKGYNSIGMLGGHTIELGKVHGKNLILNRPLKLLPKEAANYIDPEAKITNGEMFAIEIYIPDKKISGELIQNINIPVTHFQIEDNDINKLNNLSNSEREIYLNIKEETKDLVYEYQVHKKYSSNKIEKLINKKFIIKHYALDYKTDKKDDTVKFIQYEDCFIILDGKVINLSKDNIL